MKLLYCTNCKKTHATAKAIVYFSATVRLNADKIWLKDPDAIKRLPHAPVYAASPRCLICDTLTIEIIDRDGGELPLVA